MNNCTFHATRKGTVENPTADFFDVNEVKECLRKFEEGADLLITITDKRSLSKNDCLHGWIRIIANDIGENFDVVKYWAVVTNFDYTLTEIDGQEVKVPVSTSKLSNKDFGLGLTKMMAWAWETFNITLPQTDAIEYYLKYSK